MACVWCLEATLSTTPSGTWLDSNYCQEVLPTGNETVSSWTCESNANIYIAALYWAVMSITSIGYGDISATPANAWEQLVATALMLSGALMWGQLIGTFCGVISTMEPDVTEFRATMDKLNRFMKRQDIPTQMRRRLREYFHHTKHVQQAVAQRSILSAMSPALQAETAWLVNEKWMRKVTFLNGCQKAFLCELAVNLRPMVFAPGDPAPPGFLYLVHRGVCVYHQAIVGRGGFWGEDMILQSEHLRSKYSARALTFVEVFYMTREELTSIAGRFPPSYKAVRRYAVFLALRREMVLRAKIKLKEEGAHDGKTSLLRMSSKMKAFDTMLIAASSFEEKAHMPAHNASGPEG